MVVLEYWAREASEKIGKPLARYIHEIQDAIDDSAVEETVELFEGFQYLEGEIVEYEREEHEVSRRNTWISLALPDNQYKLEDETGYTKTVFEDEIL